MKRGDRCKTLTHLVIASERLSLSEAISLFIQKTEIAASLFDNLELLAMTCMRVLQRPQRGVNKKDFRCERKSVRRLQNKIERATHVCAIGLVG